MKVKVQYTNNNRQGEVFDTIADMSLIKNKFNWSPKVNLQEGIKIMNKNYK